MSKSNANGQNTPPLPPPLGPSRKRKESDGAVATATEGAGKPNGDNWLLAGYLAHEFLTRGTVLGKRRRVAKSEGREPTTSPGYESVACILMRGGAHVPNVVNPTQLSSWLQTQEKLETDRTKESTLCQA